MAQYSSWVHGAAAQQEADVKQKRECRGIKHTGV